MTLKAFIKSAALLAAAGAVVFLAVLYSGAVHVGADHPHLPGVRWVLEATRDRSIAHHGETFPVEDFQERATLLNGLRRYHDTCLPCHGAPGRAPHPFAKGLRPAPPKLWMSDREPAAVYWIVRHGLRMSAMPSFSESHGEPAVLEMAAFAVELQGMTAEEYDRMAAEALPGLFPDERRSDKSRDEASGDGS